MIQQKLNVFNLVFLFLGGLVLLFIISPLLSMFISTSGTDLIETVHNTEVQESIWLTIWTSIAATLIFAVGSIPLAYLIVRKNFRLKRLVRGIINIPVVIPHSAAGIALLGVISRNTAAGKIAESLGFSFVNSTAGIIVAMAFVSIPFLLNSSIDGFIGVPERLEKAAMTLGASRRRVFFSISLPLAWRHILTGLIMMWARGLSEFGAVIIIAYHPMTTPVMIFERFNSYGLSYAKPVTVLFLVICLAIFVFMNYISVKKRSNAKNN